MAMQMALDIVLPLPKGVRECWMCAQFVDLDDWNWTCAADEIVQGHDVEQARRCHQFDRRPDLYVEPTDNDEFAAMTEHWFCVFRRMRDGRWGGFRTRGDGRKPPYNIGTGG